jgi:hypothetical protein
MGAYPEDSCNDCYMARALKLTEQVEGQVIDAPPGFVPLEPNLSSQLSTHEHGHEPEDMLHASPN